MNGRTPGSVVTLVTPEPPYRSTQSRRTGTTIQWRVVHATTCGAQITPEITPTSEITPLRDKPQTQKNPVRNWASRNEAKETRTPDPLLLMQWVTQPRVVAAAGLLHILFHKCAPISAPDPLLKTPTDQGQYRRT